MLLDNEYAPDLRVAREIEALIESGWRVRLVCWDRQGRLPERERPADHVEVVRIRTPAGRQLGARQIPNLLTFYRKVFRRRHILLADYARVVHCHDLLMLPLGSLLASVHQPRPALIYDAHEIYVLMDSHRYPRPVLRAMEALERGLIDGQVDTFVTVSEQRAEDWWRPRLRRRPLHVVGNWYDPQPVDPARRARTRRTLGLDDGTFAVGYLGSLHHNRRVDLLIEAVAGRPDWAAIVAGRGTREPELSQRSRALANVRLLGWMADPWPIYEALDALYYVIDDHHPYAAYNAPNNVHIAAALGLPVIVGPGGEAEQLVRTHLPGVVLDRLSVPSVHDAIATVQQSFAGIDALPAFPYTWTAARDALRVAYDQALAAKEARGPQAS
jgi:glycosyltransferase involved in cell wall biosynthesis